jgi:pantoate--beta-alanine ligase
MKIISTQAGLRSWIKEKQETKKSLVAFIPTMGALHNGHASLIKKAAQECDYVVISILVNPTQFGDASDFNKYPNTLDEDAVIAREAGADLVFAPTAEDVYGGEPKAAQKNWGNLTNSYEGSRRPGHFNGVIAVVDRLLKIVDADKAYFGEKDLQQVAVVRRVAQERRHKAKIVSCELVRDDNGLALSSRNVRLSKKGAIDALLLSQALFQVSTKIKDGLSREESIAESRKSLSESSRVKLEYIDGVNENTFSPDDSPASWTHIIVAAEVEGVRLIDNIRL